MRAYALTALTVCFATNAPAQPALTLAPEATLPDSAFDVRLRYGVASHSGSQQDTGAGVTYTGFTPNDLSFTGRVWPVLDGRLGFLGHIEREAFGLFEVSSLVARVSLIRAHGGVSGRFRAGGFRAEPALAYAFDQLPSFNLSAAHVGRARHSLLLALRFAYEIGPVAVEAQLDAPLTLPVGGLPIAMGPDNFAASAGARIELARSGKLVWGVAVDGTYTTDKFAAEGVTSQQQVIRGGVALDLQWKDPPGPPVPTTGGLRISVRAAEDDSPLSEAAVTVSSASGPLSLTLGPDGSAIANDVPAGPVVATAKLKGYVPDTVRDAVVGGADTAVVLRLRKEPPKVGGLSLSVADKSNGNPIAQCTIVVGNQTAITDDSGKATVDGIPVGPVSLRITAEGYQPGQEVAAVAPQVRSQVAISLLPTKKRVLATITGTVRSARGGAPIPANLAIPEAQIKTRANAKGDFIFKVVGGTYTVSISSTGYISQTKSVTVQDGEQAIFNVDLFPR